MLKTIFSRVTQTIVVVFLLVTFVFFAVRAIPGNPFASEKALAPEEQAALERQYGLDKPISIQYFNYWKNILTEGDFGYSLAMKGRKVSTIISESFPVSLKLGVLSLILGMGLGIPLGILAALFHNRWQDYAAKKSMQLRLEQLHHSAHHTYDRRTCGLILDSRRHACPGARCPIPCHENSGGACPCGSTCLPAYLRAAD